VADPASAGERAEHDLADELGFDPADTGDVRAGRRDRERVSASLEGFEGFEASLQAGAIGLTEAGAFTGLAIEVPDPSLAAVPRERSSSRVAPSQLGGLI
jgi:hypothetical protein